MNPLITPEAAEEITLSTTPKLAVESIPLEQAWGRVLATALLADRPLPPYDRVMMDGISFREADLTKAHKLEIAGDHPAGAPAPRE